MLTLKLMPANDGGYVVWHAGPYEGMSSEMLFAGTMAELLSVHAQALHCVGKEEVR